MRAAHVIGGLAALTAAAPALLALAGEGKLTEAVVRAFLARQEAAWNAKDLAAFDAAFTPDARFVDRARGSDNRIVPNGVSTLAQANAQARRFFAKATFHEAATIDRVEMAPDGLSARVLGRTVSRIETPGRPARILCAETAQTLVVAAGRIRSRGQTDTAVRCPREVTTIQSR